MKSKNHFSNSIQIKSHTQLSSQLPIKILFLSYINKKQTNQTITDCYNAINDRIQKLSSSISQNYEQINQIVGDSDDKNSTKNNKKKSNQMMQIIEQEEQNNFTQRSNNQGDDENLKFNNSGKKYNQSDSNTNSFAKKFNKSIGVLQSAYNKFQDIMFMYKKQIKSIAKDLTKQREINKQLQQQVKNMTPRVNSKQGRSMSLSKVSNTKTSVALNSLLKPPMSINKQTKKKIINVSSRQVGQSQDEQIRAPPKPFCQQCVNRQKQQSIKQKKSMQQKNKWRELSTKITNLKNQLSSYEQQLVHKQSQILKLQQQLKKKSQQNTQLQTQQKKKLRSMNTTLRGQKIVLQNQVQSLKKRLQQNQQYLNKIQSDNKKLLLQKQNIQSTMKWQSNTIQDLRNNFSSGLKQDNQLIKKLQQSQSINKTLYRQIQDQQRYLEQFMKKLEEIQNQNKEQVQKLTNKIKDLENIIEKKNQTIVKLKINNKNDVENNPSLGNTQNIHNLYHKQEHHSHNQSINGQHQNYGIITTKTTKKDQYSSLNSTTNLTGISSQQGFQQNMIKTLNKKLIEKQYAMQKIQKQNQVLKQEIEVLNQTLKSLYSQ